MPYLENKDLDMYNPLITNTPLNKSKYTCITDFHSWTYKIAKHNRFMVDFLAFLTQQNWTRPTSFLT